MSLWKAFFIFCDVYGQLEYLWRDRRVAVIGYILCTLGNLIFSVRSGTMQGGNYQFYFSLFYLVCQRQVWQNNKIFMSEFILFFSSFHCF